MRLQILARDAHGIVVIPERGQHRLSGLTPGRERAVIRAFTHQEAVRRGRVVRRTVHGTDCGEYRGVAEVPRQEIVDESPGLLPIRQHPVDRRFREYKPGSALFFEPRGLCGNERPVEFLREAMKTVPGHRLLLKPPGNGTLDDHDRLGVLGCVGLGGLNAGRER